MVAIFAGGGTGLERSSGNIIGAAGTIGSSATGRSGSQVQVNAANGNLVIARQDEFLSTVGDDVTVLRVYNSQGDLTDTNGDNWRMGENRVLRGLIGTANGPNSSIERVATDGSVVVHYWNGSAYIANAGAGAHDRITWDGINWRWQDGDSGTVETYGADLRLARSTDRSGHVTQFAYSDGRLSRITAHDGGYLDYAWSGNLITGITSVSQGATTIRTRYGYDGLGRLSSVSVDRTANDNSVADGNVYTTTYGYHGSSRLIASITETDGSSVQIGYDGANRVTRIEQLVAGGVARITALAYETSRTTITDPLGQVTAMTHDGAGRLHMIVAPPAVPGAAAQQVQFLYNVANDLTGVIDATGATTTFGHDTNGNVLRQTDRAGDEVTRTYNAANRILTETRLGSDRWSTTSTASQQTTRYVYDSLNRLRYVVSAAGRVQETRYDGNGLVGFVIDYAANVYNLGGLSPSTALSEAQLNSWRDNSDRTQTSVTQFGYDARGNLTQKLTYGATNADGSASKDDGYTHEYFIYDAAGQLLSRGPASRAKETYSYDGLGRVIQSTDVNGGTTRITFDDAATQTTVTMADGFVRTQTYSKTGELLGQTESGSYVTGGTAGYQYDAAGRLRIATDATGRKTYTVYDGAGRRVADIAGNGEMIEYRHDANDRIVGTVRYYTNITIPAALNDPNAAVSVASLRPAANAGGDLWDWTVYDREGRVVQTIDGDGSTSVNAYDDSGRLIATTAYVVKLTAEQLAAFRSSAPSAVTLPATHAGDSVSRIFYDRDGNVIGTLDGEGYLSQTIYDGGGRKIEEIGYGGATAANLRGGASFQSLIDSAVAAGTVDNRSTRFVYDQQGHLRYTIDALKRVTEYGYHYDSTKWTAFGPVRETIRYAQPIATLSTFTVDTVRAALAGNASDPANRTDWSVYDATGRLTHAIDASGAVTAYRYDNRGRVIARVEYATFRTTTTLPSAETMANWSANTQADADRTTRFYYSARGELRFTIDAEGFVTRNDYDAEGRVVSTVRWSNRVAPTDGWTTATVDGAVGGDLASASRSYDARGRLSSEWDNAGRSTRYSYRANGLLTWEIRSQGKSDETTILHGYDLAGRRAYRVTAHGTAEASTTSYVHDGLGNLIRTIDGDGAITAWTYDRAGQVVTETNAQNAVTRHQYDAYGNRVLTTDQRGNATYRYFDRLDRTVAVRDAENYVTETGYTAFGDVASIKRSYARATNAASVGVRPTGHGTHALDATTTFEYDRIGRVVKTTDAEGHSERYTLDAFGNRVRVHNKLGGLTVQGFDRRGLRTWQTLTMASVKQDGAVQASTVVNRFEYDARGNRIRLIEAQGLSEERVTRYSYDKADRLVEVRGPSVPYVDASSQVGYTDFIASYRYDTRGNLIESRAANGARTLSYYDDNDRKVAEIGSTGTLSTWAYDKTGDMVASRVYGTIVALPAEPGGTPPAAPGGEFRETGYGYDNLGRLRSTTITDIRSGRWDGSSFILTTAAIATAYQYDSIGNLIAETDAEGASTFSFYDRNGRRTAQVDREGYVTRWGYDAERNVTSERRYANQVGGAAAGVLPATVDSGADRITEFGYDRNGNRTVERRLNVEAVTVFGASMQSASGPSTIYYDYNALGKIVRKTEATGDRTEYVYDTMGRLVEELHPWFGDKSGNEVRSKFAYSYDGLGNLTRTEEGFRPYAGAHRITAFYYGAGGRLTAKVDAAGGRTDYGYDAAGNVVQESRVRQTSDGTTLSEAMLTVRDLAGRIVSQGMGQWNGSGWIRGDVQQTAYNAYGEISQRGMNGGWQEQFAYDRAGRLFRSNAGDGVWRYFVHDRVGNRTAVIESEGTAIGGNTLDGMLSYATHGFAYGVGQASIDGINTTLTVYDRRGQATGTILPNRQLHDQNDGNLGNSFANIETARAYNAFGEVVWERDARGYYTHMAYNAMGRMLWRQRPQVEVTDENGATRLVNPTEYFHYDISGRAVASRDARGGLTTRMLLAGTGYGGTEALVERETTADGAVVVRRYDQFLNLRMQRDGIGRLTYMEYDAMGRLTQVLRPGGQSDHYAYDMLGQRIRQWNSQYGAANAERTDYDMQGRVVRQVSAGSSEGIADVTTTSYNWSAGIATDGMGTFGGWVTTTTFANGRTSTEHADMFGRTVRSVDLGGNVTTFGHDLAGRITWRLDGEIGNGERTDYRYLNTGLVAAISRGEDQSETAAYNPGAYFMYEEAVYGYDAAGNRTSERHSYKQGNWENHGGSGGWTGYDPDDEPRWVYHQDDRQYQNATARYDALGRLTRWEESGGTYVSTASLDYRYDENGNIRRSTARFYNIDNNGSMTAPGTQDYWYRYDAMNRVTLVKGQLSGDQITPGYGGVTYQYDLAGQRVASTRLTSASAWVEDPYGDGYNPRLGGGGGGGQTIVYYDAEQREEYGYDLDGRLTSVRVGTQGYYDNGDGTVTVTDPPKLELKATFGYDGMGRQTGQTDYLYDGDSNGTVAWQRVTAFNARSQVVSETSWQRQGNDTIQTATTNYYGSGANYALGSITSASSATYKNNGYQYGATTTNAYGWYAGAVLSSTTYAQSGQSARTSTYQYDRRGRLEHVGIQDGRPRDIGYTNDLTGQVIERREQDRDYGKGDPREVWYRFNGRTLGYVGNNGTQDTSYQASIGSRTRTQGTGAFDGGSVYGSAYADFDQSVAPITSYAQGAGGGSYTVRGGDTLSGIAAQLWGDAGLWYRLAEANGLGGASALVAGQSLTIPTGVQKSTHSAATFTPYDPAEAMGDTAPSVQPKAKKNKCGAFGAILLSVIAVAVTALTAVALPAAVSPILTGALSATAGSVVSQAVGVATGIQDRFDWKGVALAGLSGAVGGALGNVSPFGSGTDFLSGFANGAVRGALGSFVTQGIGVATGLQRNMNWLGVATAGVGGGVAGGMGNALGLTSLQGNLSAGNIARTALTNTAGGIANAATRALATGTSFGDNLIAVLPDVLGQTVGGVVAGGIARGMGTDEVPAATGMRIDAGVADELANYEAPGIDLSGGAAVQLPQIIARQNYREARVAETLAAEAASAAPPSDPPMMYEGEFVVTGRRDGRRAVRTVEGVFGSSAAVRREKAAYQTEFDSKPGYYNVPAYNAAMAAYDYWSDRISGIEAKVDAQIDQEMTGILLTGPLGGGVGALGTIVLGSGLVAGGVSSGLSSAASGSSLRYAQLQEVGAGTAAQDFASGVVGYGVSRGFATLAGRAIDKIGQPRLVAAESATARAARLGREGEAAAGIDGPKVGVEINGRMRFPDELSPNLLKEVKNVAKQGWTKQLRDYSDLARERGIPFELWVRQNTRLSGPLRTAEIRGDVIIRRELPRQ